MSQDAPHYGEMTEQRARELLRPEMTADRFENEEGFKFENVDWATWFPGDRNATLDGDYTAEELEAIAWWMRNKP